MCNRGMTCSVSSMEMEENNEDAISPSDIVSDILNASRQLVVAVSKLGQEMAHSKQPPGMVFNRQASTLPKFSGWFRKAYELDEWVKDAKENIIQVEFQGEEIVKYLCGFL